MVLGQPHRVEAAAIHDFDALERTRIDLFQGPMPARPGEELQHAYFHGHSALMPASFMTRAYSSNCFLMWAAYASPHMPTG